MSFLGGLVDSFTGKSARGDLDKGINAVGAGRDSAIGAYKQAGDQAQGYLKDYRDQGGGAFKLYGDTLGVNGAGARGSAEDLYNSDDMLAKQRAYDLSRSGRQQNASGSFNSGTAALADSRVRMQGYGDWQNRLGAAGQAGQAAAGTSAGLAAQTGGEIGAADMGAAGQTAGLYGQRASSENTFAQNLIGLGSVATNALGGRPAVSNNLGAQPYPQQPGYPQSGVSTRQPQPAWYNPTSWFS